MGKVQFEKGMVNSILNRQVNDAIKLAYPVGEKVTYAYSVLDGNGSVLEERVFSSYSGVACGSRQPQLDARWKDSYLYFAKECAHEAAKKKKRITRLKKLSLVLDDPRLHAYGLYLKQFAIAIGVVTENAEFSKLLAKLIKSILSADN